MLCSLPNELWIKNQYLIHLCINTEYTKKWKCRPTSCLPSDFFLLWTVLYLNINSTNIILYSIQYIIVTEHDAD